MDFGLRSSSLLIELRTELGDNAKDVHDLVCLWSHVGGDVLVVGEGIRSDVIDAGAEVIALIIELVGEDVG